MDHAATSPLHPEALKAMLPYFTEHYGNPSSTHRFGRKAKQALEGARRELATSIGATPNEIIFTSGGTEADNLAIIGYVKKNFSQGHIVTTQIEHHAVLRACQHLEEIGYDVTYLPVSEDGQVCVEQVQQALRDDTVLVTVMLGNNETGVIQPIAEIGSILQERNIAFHTDAVQAYGMIPIDVNELKVDLLSVSSHKINGPKGVGFLYARANLKIAPLLFGGEQERKRRAGTENVSSIVGFQEALRIAYETQETKFEQYQMFKDEMIQIFKEENIEFTINGNVNNCLPHIFNVSFIGMNVETLLVHLDLAGIAVSSGSACTAGTHQPSHVLKAMKCSDERLHSAIRFSFGYGNTLDDVNYVARETAKIVKQLSRR